MPTQIIDGFSLNAARPIDSRLVTSGESSRNSMSYRYVGLRVYDTVDKKSFVWDGTAWKEDGGGGSDFKLTYTKADYITKYTATGVTGSGIREVAVGQNRYVGINMSENAILNVPLHVGGAVCATNFCGEINGSNITNNTISTQKICTANQAGNYVLKSINNVVTWAAETSGGGGGGGSTTIQNDTTSTTSFISFVNSPSATDFRASCLSTNTFIGADLSSSQLTLSNTNDNTKPAYSFIGSKNTGLYGGTTEVGISLGGNKRIYANATTTKIAVGSTTLIDVSSTCVGLKADTTVSGTINASGLSISGTGTVNGDFTVSAGKNTSLGNCLSVTNMICAASNVDIKGRLDVCSCTLMCVNVDGYATIIRNDHATGCALIVRHQSGCGIILKESVTATTNNASKIYYEKLNGTIRGTIGYDANKTYLSVKNGTGAEVNEIRFYSDDLKRRLKANRIQINNSMVYAGIYNLSLRFSTAIPRTVTLNETSKKFFDSTINTGFTNTTKWLFEYVNTSGSSSYNYIHTYKITHNIGNTNYTPIISPRWSTLDDPTYGPSNGSTTLDVYVANYISVKNITNNTFEVVIYNNASWLIDVDILIMAYTDDTDYDFYV
jgi:hypothetical protein